MKHQPDQPYKIVRLSYGFHAEADDARFSGDRAMAQVQPSPQPISRACGRLKLRFTRRDDEARTILSVLEQQPPLKVVRAFNQPDGVALVHIHNVSGGILGGDQLEIIADVEKNAAVQMTTTGATRIYRKAPDAEPARQNTVIRVAENALLEYVPDPLIPFAGSCYFQDTRIELAKGAGLFWWETISPGRAAAGELFEYDSLNVSLRILAEGRPIAIEQVSLRPASHPLGSLARLGRFQYSTCFYICRIGLATEVWSELECTLTDVCIELSRKGEVWWGAGAISAHGVSVRGVSLSHRDITDGLPRFWTIAKEAIYQRTPILPRKTP